MSWRKIAMKFPGTCIVCNQKIEVNEIGLWSKGAGVKHERCAAKEIKELNCAICGGPTGCARCEFQDDCDREAVSGMCVCKNCLDSKDPYLAYKKAVMKGFPVFEMNSD
ncbi:hypothetical protein [Candidatus Nitrosotenuis uzonensis]|uniref:Uncharacterized protein n=1 Tax=Candidatus Nitrosotenuis uzonensis TaxID=1407055 RepID=V6AUR8_9ARCH|nr:hypothetical protein [Candidatus Nitrosotenuis uzonensis]CDI06279.1 conserved hypothetical protein [Candidatus Nitrosotenuis uzonensis]